MNLSTRTPGDELEIQVGDVRSGVTPTGAPTASSPFAPRHTLPRHMGVVVVLVALAVVVAASPELRVPALALLAGPQAPPTATLLPVAHVIGNPELTPVPGPQLRWQPVAALPDNLNAPGGDVNLAVAPSAGRIAYACDVMPLPQGTPTASGETSQFRVTYDRGAQWTPALAITAQPNATACSIAIDALDPSLVVVASSYADPTDPNYAPNYALPSPNQTVSEVTFDGGATWQRLAGNQLIQQPSTVGGVTIALRATQTGQGSSVSITYGLAMSRDQLRTWTPIDAALRAASPQEGVLSYWLNPTTGALLAQTQDLSIAAPTVLWSSTDTGQHWRKLPSPGGGGPVIGSFVIQPPAGDAPWHICTTAPENVVCSADGGATWTSIPSPVPRLQHPPGMLPDTRMNDGLLLTTDGMLLLTGASEVDAQGTGYGVTLYRLPAGATRWQTLGPVPQPLVFYAAGALWAEQLAAGQPGSPWFYAHGQVFTASYS
jgi:hypothetical protein